MLLKPPAQPRIDCIDFWMISKNQPSQSKTRIPVILVTGFLGSGKTTFLRRLAAERPELHLLFLVNEFANTSVDSETLAADGLPSQSVVGGSLFCECKAADFIKVMRETVAGIHQKQAIDAVVIETSGIADPEAIGCLLKEHGLSRQYTVEHIVTIVAPGNFRKLLANLPVVEAQVRTSDLVILNKTDLAAENEILWAEDAIRQINRATSIQRAKFCAGIEIHPSGKPLELPVGELATCDSNPFSVKELTLQGDSTLHQVEEWIRALPAEILRVKGNFRTAEGRWSVERTVDSVEIKESIFEGDGKLVLIAHDDHEALLHTCTEDILQ